MRAVTFEAPGVVRVSERPAPVLEAPGDAVVAIAASGICGSDLHIYRGRVRIEPGFTIGHEFAGTVVAAGDDVTRVAVGDRVLGCFHTACGRCFFCLRGIYHRCVSARVFGHGEAMGALPGTQAEQALVPAADMTLRRIPEGVSDELALFAGDVLGTGYHAVLEAGIAPGDSLGVVGLGPVGLCAVQAARLAGAEPVLAIDRHPDRLELARSFGAVPVHRTEESPREVARRSTGGRGLDAVVEAAGSPEALELATRLARAGGTVVAVGAYTEPFTVHMGLVWIKALTLRTGQANVIAHVDRVLALLSAGRLDPGPLVTHRLALDDAPEGYAIYDRREALKVVLRP